MIYIVGLRNPEKYKAMVKRKNAKKRSLPANRIALSMSSIINFHIKDKNKEHTFDILGYSLEELQNHLESQFHSGMSWDNYGRNGWHIEHIRAVSRFSFDSKGDIEFKECFSLRNLQPMWESENLSKSDKITFNWKYDLEPLINELFELS